MPDPEIVQFLNMRKKAIALKEQAAMRDLAKQWLKVEQSLEDQMVALAADLSNASVVTEAMILKHDRYVKLLYQARAEVAKFNDYAAEAITKTQAEMSKAGIKG